MTFFGRANIVTFKNTSTVTISTDASTEIVPANPARKGLILQCISPDGGWIKCDGTAAKETGLFLAPSASGVITMDSGMLTKGQINGFPPKIR